MQRLGLAAGAAAAFALVLATGGSPSVAQQCLHPDEQIPFALAGDLRATGQVNVADALCAVQLALLWAQSPGGAAPPACLKVPLALADVNCDGVVNITDVTLVVRLATLGAFPAELDPDAHHCPSGCTYIPSGGGAPGGEPAVAPPIEPLVNAPLGLEMQTPAIVLPLFEGEAQASVTGDGEPALSVNGGPFTLAAPVLGGDTVILQALAPTTPGATHTVTFELAGTTSSWTLTAPTFGTSFAPSLGTAPGAWAYSNLLTVNLEGPGTIEVFFNHSLMSGDNPGAPELRINSGPWIVGTPSNGPVVQPGDTIQLRGRASAYAEHWVNYNARLRYQGAVVGGEKVWQVVTDDTGLLPPSGGITPAMSDFDVADVSSDDWVVGGPVTVQLSGLASANLHFFKNYTQYAGEDLPTPQISLNSPSDWQDGTTSGGPTVADGDQVWFRGFPSRFSEYEVRYNLRLQSGGSSLGEHVWSLLRDASGSAVPSASVSPLPSTFDQITTGPDYVIAGPIIITHEGLDAPTLHFFTNSTPCIAETVSAPPQVSIGDASSWQDGASWNGPAVADGVSVWLRAVPSQYSHCAVGYNLRVCEGASCPFGEYTWTLTRGSDGVDVPSGGLE